MASFRAVPEDFDEAIRNEQWTAVRRRGPYPLAALVGGIVFLFIYPPVGLVAIGMSIAWSVSAFLDWRSIKAVQLWRHAWAQEDVVIDIEDDGLRLSNQRGSGFVRWSSGAVVRSSSTCFVLEEEGENIAVMPKRYLTRPLPRHCGRLYQGRRDAQRLDVDRGGSRPGPLRAESGSSSWTLPVLLARDGLQGAGEPLEQREVRVQPRAQRIVVHQRSAELGLQPPQPLRRRPRW